VAAHKQITASLQRAETLSADMQLHITAITKGVWARCLRWWVFASSPCYTIIEKVLV